METPIQKTFGTCIRNFRLQNGLSQEKFALKIGMDRTYYASIESGKRNLSLVNIKKIADGLGISLGDLFSAIDQYMSIQEEPIYDPF